MGNPTNVTTENPEPRRRPGGAGTKGIPAAASYSDERPSRGPWPSEAPLTGVLGELPFYYGACWLHYRSEQRRGK